MTQQFVVKSFTNIDLFQTCPKWFFHRAILKESEPETPELKAGNEIHKAMEMRVAKGHMLKPAFQQFEPIAASLINARAGRSLACELKLGITRAWQPCDFFASDVWLRGAIDVLLRGPVGAGQFDYKNGKPSDKTKQLEITNMLTLLRFPELQTVTGMNIYLKDGSFRPKVVTTRADLPHLTHNLAMEIHEMEEAEATGDFPPTPNGLCNGWCPVKSCRFWKPKK